ncbi:2924_t:CDS:2, partial [Dentiscutata heterogama]
MKGTEKFSGMLWTIGMLTISQIRSRPINRAVRGQVPQNVDIPVNSSYDNLSAEQKYENLTKGTTADLFNTRKQETENQEAPQFSTFISGSESPF